MLLFSGVLTWAGLFKDGKSYRSCWMGLEGGGFLYGSTGSNGLFSGPRIAYIYPGKKTLELVECTVYPKRSSLSVWV